MTRAELVAILKAMRETATDDVALQGKELYPVWAAGIAVTEGQRFQYSEKLYKVRQAHTTQADWTPDATPALWAVIDVTHAGTAEDPIPASRGMDYTYGLYYSDPEDSRLYLCTRIGATEGDTINLQYLPHELIGQYFEEVA